MLPDAGGAEWLSPPSRCGRPPIRACPEDQTRQPNLPWPQSAACRTRDRSIVSSSRSEATISATSCSNEVLCCQPSFDRGLRRIADQQVDFGRTEIAWIDLDQNPAGAGVNALFIGPFPAPLDRHSNLAKRPLDEFPHRMRLAGCQHIVIGLRLLQNSPHAVNIIAGMAPVALGFEVAQKQLSAVDQV